MKDAAHNVLFIHNVLCVYSFYFVFFQLCSGPSKCVHHEADLKDLCLKLLIHGYMSERFCSTVVHGFLFIVGDPSKINISCVKKEVS